MIRIQLGIVSSQRQNINGGMWKTSPISSVRMRVTMAVEGTETTGKHYFRPFLSLSFSFFTFRNHATQKSTCRYKFDWLWRITRLPNTKSTSFRSWSMIELQFSLRSVIFRMNWVLPLHSLHDGKCDHWFVSLWVDSYISSFSYYCDVCESLTEIDRTGRTEDSLAAQLKGINCPQRAGLYTFRKVDH